VGGDPQDSRDPQDDAKPRTDEERALHEGRLRLERVVAALDFDRPALATLAGEAPTRLNALLEQGQVLLAEQRYIDAERRFTSVLTYQPGHVPARIGQVHAQLGAGLIRSAAANLRALLGEHPALIGQRYEAHLLPPVVRLAQLDEQLRATAQRGDRPDAALLLAYLGYQSGSSRLTQYGLALGESQSPADPLWPILRTLWLAEPAGPVNPPPDPGLGTDAEDPPSGRPRP
jgi:hypothetical protein